MPELPEVETVKETLKRNVLYKRIAQVKVLYPNIIASPTVLEFKNALKGEVIQDIKRRGKWLVFELDNYYLFSHLRMEGKYFMKSYEDEIEKHEHVIFIFDDKTELRYRDTRKFGKMHLVKKEEINEFSVLKELGLEPWDDNLTEEYLLSKYKNKNLPIKTVLLDQSIIVGIGNIYADEILFLSNIYPLKKVKDITKIEAEKIITHTKGVLQEAILQGGTTIRSYESSEGVHGRFQQSLHVHNREKEACPVCKDTIIKIKVGGRGTYYCPTCQISI